MAEYISMDCLWKCETCFHHRSGKCSPGVWCENGENYRPDYSVLQFSAIEAEPVRHGHNTGNARIFECSECGYGYDDIYLTDEHNFDPDEEINYCPHCGAKMDKENDNEKNSHTV
jgi:hypothetical protein